MAHFRCASIGCGGMSSLHAAAYATRKNCGIVAVADNGDCTVRFSPSPCLLIRT